MQPVPLISYQEFISIVLTALAVMLAVLGVGIAVLAILGYAGLKKGLHDMAKRHVEGAMAEKLKEYPSAAEMMEDIRRQMVAGPAPRSGEIKANIVGQSQVAAEPTASVGEPYPGEEPPDAHNPEHHD